MEFDEGSIFYSNQERGDGARADTESPASARIKYFQFIRTYREGNVFIYRDKLRQAVSLGIPELEVDLDHVMAWDDVLADDLQERPAFHLPHFEQAALEAAKSMDILDPEALDMPSFQITLMSTKKRITIRELVSSQVSRVVIIPGIVISSSKVKAKATKIFAQCKGCQTTTQVPVRAGEPKRREQGFGAGAGFLEADPVLQQRLHDKPQGRNAWDHPQELADIAQRPATYVDHLVRLRAGDVQISIVVQHAHGALGWQVVAEDRAHQGGLADPGFAGQHDTFARSDF